MFRHQKRIALAIVVIIVAALAISLVGSGAPPSNQGLDQANFGAIHG